MRWGAVDRNGELVVPLQFEYLSYWRGGYGYAKEGKPYTNNLPNEVREGIVKSDGSLLAGRYFDKVDIREEGTLPRALLARTIHEASAPGSCEHGLSVVG